MYVPTLHLAFSLALLSCGRASGLGFDRFDDGEWLSLLVLIGPYWSHGIWGNGGFWGATSNNLPNNHTYT